MLRRGARGESARVKSELLHTFVADRRLVSAIERLPDGSLVTGGADGHLRRWDPTHWIELSAVDAHGRGVRALHVGEGGIVSVGGDRALRVWDAVEGRPRFAVSRRVAGRLEGGRLLGNSSRGRICLHDPQSGALEGRLPRLDDRVTCFALAPDGDGVLGGSADGLFFLPLDGGAPCRWSGLGPLQAIDADGRGACSVGEDGQICGWSGNGERRWLTRAEGAVPHALRLSPDGQRVALSMAYQVEIRDMADGRLVGSIKSRLKGLFGLAWSAAGDRLYCAAADGRVRVWTLEG